MDLYHEGDFGLASPYMWCFAVKNVSQLWALYCLVLFYEGTHEQLAELKPLGKFLTIKSIVFFTWWQAIIIQMMVQNKYVLLLLLLRPPTTTRRRPYSYFQPLTNSLTN